MNRNQQAVQGTATNTRVKWVLLGFLLIAAYFLITEHRAHLGGVLNYLPILLLIACPFMHMFMHHGHSGGHETSSSNDGQEVRK